MKKNHSKLYARPYLSWSQLDLFEKSPEQYFERYFGQGSGETEAMRLGKELALALELREYNYDRLDIEKVKGLFTYCDEREKKLELCVAGVPILAILDGYLESSMTILEYKSGKTVWTDSRVNQHGQLDFYGVAVWRSNGSPDRFPKAILEWGETAGDPPVFVGTVKKFERQIKAKDIILMEARIKRVWNEIGLYCAQRMGI